MTPVTITNICLHCQSSLASWPRVGGLLLSAGATVMLLGCGTATVPVAGSVADRGAEMYAIEASQHSTAATLAAQPVEVYAAMLRLAEKSSKLHVVQTDASRLQVKMAQGGKHLTAEATALRDSGTLLHVWTNTGSSGQPARDYARAFLSQLSDELNVEYQLVDM